MGDSPIGRPLAVLLSGAPGSGKSTLAGVLGERLRTPVVDKDRIRQGMLWALGTRDIDRAPPGPPLWYAVMEAHLRLGISVVGDMALFAGVSDEEIPRRLGPLADLFNVHCVAANTRDRVLQRAGRDPVHAHRVDYLSAQMDGGTEQTSAQLSLGCPALVVDTTSGYEPSLDQIVDAILAFGRRRREDHGTERRHSLRSPRMHPNPYFSQGDKTWGGRTFPNGCTSASLGGC
jgi:predicted kinase